MSKGQRRNRKNIPDRSNRFYAMRKKQKVFVAMSGGVDSSVAALLLERQGYDTVGVFMRCFNLDGCEERDAEDARRVAECIGIPFYVWNFEEEYKKKVVDYMIDGYRMGLTPNPDVMCNKEIKFGLFLERALKLGTDFMATGHYVRLRRTRNPNLRTHPNTPNEKIRSIRVNSYFSHRSSLFEAEDKNKDQSYFLWILKTEQLRHCLFPLGDYLKTEVRAMAREAGLPTAEKKDSQGICFLGKVSLRDFLKKYLSEKRGVVITDSGKKIGRHEGSHFYTIGQRHGLDLRGKNKELGAKGERITRPHYVAEKNTGTNTIVVVEGADNPLLFKSEIELTNLNLSGSLNESDIYKGGVRVFARVRYRQPLSAARLEQVESEKLKVKSYRLVFERPQKFVAAGQSAVFYSKSGGMLGGGVIS